MWIAVAFGVVAVVGLTADAGVELVGSTALGPQPQTVPTSDGWCDGSDKAVLLHLSPDHKGVQLVIAVERIGCSEQCIDSRAERA